MISPAFVLVALAALERECDQYSGGASIEDKGSAVCHKWTTPHAQDDHFVRTPKGRRSRRLTSAPSAVAKSIGECRPVSLPKGMDKKMDLDLIKKIGRMVQLAPCPPDMALIKDTVTKEDLSWHEDCLCDAVHHPSVNTVEDIDQLGAIGGTDMCVRLEQKWDAKIQKHVDIRACYPNHPEFPIVGQSDGGGLTFNGCRSDMSPCVHANPVRVAQVACGDAHCCALARGGSVACWGDDDHGQSGGATRGGPRPAIPAPSPIKLGGEVVEVAAINESSCALLADGSLMCWGGNKNGELGTGATEKNPRPTPTLVDAGGKVARIFGGPKGYVFFALLADGSLVGWGGNWQGQAGTGEGGDENVLTPTKVAIDLGGEVEFVSMGMSYTCALLKSGLVKCWGSNDAGPAGEQQFEADGTVKPKYEATLIELGDSATSTTYVATALVTLNNHACAVLKDGKVKCWGVNTSGQLGVAPDPAKKEDRPPTDILVTPNLVDLGGKAATAVAGTSQASCALLTDGDVWCWGNNYLGALALPADGSYAADIRPTPVRVAGLGGKAVAIFSAVKTLHAVLEDGSVMGWGSNNDYRLGIGSYDDGIFLPTRVKTRKWH